VKNAITKSLGASLTFEEAVEATFRDFAGAEGNLTASQLQASMRSIGLQLSDQNVQDMIQEADQQGRGFVDFTDFVHICRNSGMGLVKAA